MVAATLPGVVDDPRQLAAANAALAWIEGGATLAGPAITAISFAVAGPWLAFAVFAGFLVIATVASIGVNGVELVTEADERVAFAEASRAVRHDSGLRAVLAASAACSFAVGALDLLYVVLAVDVLHGRDADAGWLNTAFGIGTLIGGSVALLLARGRSLWNRVVLGAVMFAFALAVLGFGRDRVVTAVLLTACGTAQAVLMASVRTLLQRVTELRLLCHVFALAEALHTAMLLLGALLVPVFVNAFGARWAGVGVALIVVVAVTPGARAMARADRVANRWLSRIPILRRAEVFALLPAPALETLAREARPVAVDPGTVIIREGERGDRYYALTSGRVAVARAGQPIATRGVPEGIGELALLHDMPRTATVTAIDEVEMLAVDRTTFLVAVTGHAPTLHLAATVVADRYDDLK